MQRLALGVILSSLILCAACGKRVEYRYLYAEPPAILTEETPAPVWSGRTNKDLIPHVQNLRLALDQCNADKQAIRDWSEAQHPDNALK